MRSLNRLLRVCSVVFGIFAAIAGAVALTVLAIWLFDRSSPNGDWKELGVALALGLLAALCVVVHRSARSAAMQWPGADSSVGTL